MKPFVELPHGYWDGGLPGFDPSFDDLVPYHGRVICDDSMVNSKWYGRVARNEVDFNVHSSIVELLGDQHVIVLSSRPYRIWARVEGPSEELVMLRLML